jgi:hypothetical protein
MIESKKNYEAMIESLKDSKYLYKKAYDEYHKDPSKVSKIYSFQKPEESEQ